MALLDALGRRWMLRIAWELGAGPLSFNELQSACEGISPSVLSQRLRDLIDLELVSVGADGRYRRTATGEELGKLLGPLDQWAKGWARRLSRRRRAPTPKG
jgi:DNA-binding HxlR family transcriptional regulator